MSVLVEPTAAGRLADRVERLYVELRELQRELDAGLPAGVHAGAEGHLRAACVQLGAVRRLIRGAVIP